MISMTHPLPIGNAISVLLQPPAGAERWRVLRKDSVDLEDIEDPHAIAVFEGEERFFVDHGPLINEVMVFYRPFYLIGGAWVPGGSAVGVTPEAYYDDHTIDVITFLRRRIEEGLKVEIKRGNLVADMGYIQVFTAPPSIDHNLRFPLVSLGVEVEDPLHRGIGEDVGPDDFYEDEFEFEEHRGWLAMSRIAVIGWSQNADERAELRRALRRIIVGNIPVFQGVGIDQVAITFSDIDLVSGEFDAPIYQTAGTFVCTSPVRIGGRIGAVRDVDVHARSINDYQEANG